MLRRFFRSRSGNKERDLLTIEIAEVKEIADIIFKRLEEKIEVLRAIETSVDEKMGTLERLILRAESIMPRLEAIDRQHEIVALSRKGLKITEIADILDIPAGEVELTLNLQAHRS